MRDTLLLGYLQNFLISYVFGEMWEDCTEQRILETQQWIFRLRTHNGGMSMALETSTWSSADEGV